MSNENLITYLQEFDFDCGAGFAGIILRNLGYTSIDHSKLIQMLKTTPNEGTSIYNLVAFIKSLPGLDPVIQIKSTYEDLQRETRKGRVCGVAYQNWDMPVDNDKLEWGHYAIVYRAENNKIDLLDPGEKTGLYNFDREEFERRWIDRDEGYIYEQWMVSFKLFD